MGQLGPIIYKVLKTCKGNHQIFVSIHEVENKGALCKFITYQTKYVPKSNIMGVKTQKVAISATMIIDKSTLAKNVEQTVFKVVEPNRVNACPRDTKKEEKKWNH